jgi:hypothetical protein
MRQMEGAARSRATVAAVTATYLLLVYLKTSEIAGSLGWSLRFHCSSCLYFVRFIMPLRTCNVIRKRTVLLSLLIAQISIISQAGTRIAIQSLLPPWPFCREAQFGVGFLISATEISGNSNHQEMHNGEYTGLLEILLGGLAKVSEQGLDVGSFA